MLIVKVFVNEKQIDELAIENVSSNFLDFATYKIQKPQIENAYVKHRRSTGWMPLVKSVLDFLIERRIKK